MRTKLRSGAATGKTDKNGRDICVHHNIADSTGAIYYVNSYCQAVPKDDGAATDLDELLEREHGDVRVLSADEVLSMGSAAQAPIEKKTRRPRRKAADLPDESKAVPAPEMPAEAKESAIQEKPSEAPAQKEKPDADIPADVALILHAIPDSALAGELHRRGYVFTAVKPILLTL